jgi:hypothetical protein
MARFDADGLITEARDYWHLRGGPPAAAGLGGSVGDSAGVAVMTRTSTANQQDDRPSVYRRPRRVS